jgi:hypothetical protein
MARKFKTRDSVCDIEKKELLWPVVWLLLALFIAIPMAGFLCPFWLFLQLGEPFLPIRKK